MHEHRGPAIAVAGIAVAFVTVFAALAVVLGWFGLSVYAIVKWIGRGPDTINGEFVVLLFVQIVMLLTILLALAMHAAGRSMISRKRRDPDEHV
ncbi:MAG: hypothetical protein ACM3OO_04755 [Planctomycetaceae bacterium]